MLATIDRIKTILADKYKLDQEVIERITRSQFEFVSTTIEQGEFQSIRLHHLGVFGVKPKRLEQLEDDRRRLGL